MKTTRNVPASVRQRLLNRAKNCSAQQSVLSLSCPECSGSEDKDLPENVWDNGWVLTLDMDVVRSHAATFGVAAAELTAGWVFDHGYVTWAGITPDDTATRNREREDLLALAKTDLRAYLAAMRQWGVGREKRFSGEGWRKMQ